MGKASHGRGANKSQRARVKRATKSQIARLRQHRGVQHEELEDRRMLAWFAAQFGQTMLETDATSASNLDVPPQISPISTSLAAPSEDFIGPWKFEFRPGDAVKLKSAGPVRVTALKLADFNVNDLALIRVGQTVTAVLPPDVVNGIWRPTGSLVGTAEHPITISSISPEGSKPWQLLAIEAQVATPAEVAAVDDNGRVETPVQPPARYLTENAEEHPFEVAAAPSNADLVVVRLRPGASAEPGKSYTVKIVEHVGFDVAARTTMTLIVPSTEYVQKFQTERLQLAHERLTELLAVDPTADGQQLAQEVARARGLDQPMAADDLTSKVRQIRSTQAAFQSAAVGSKAAKSAATSMVQQLKDLRTTVRQSWTISAATNVDILGPLGLLLGDTLREARSQATASEAAQIDLVAQDIRSLSAAFWTGWNGTENPMPTQRTLQAGTERGFLTLHAPGASQLGERLRLDVPLHLMVESTTVADPRFLAYTGPANPLIPINDINLTLNSSAGSDNTVTKSTTANLAPPPESNLISAGGVGADTITVNRTLRPSLDLTSQFIGSENVIDARSTTMSTAAAAAGTPASQAYFKFDLTSLPQDITSASISLKQTGGPAGISQTIEIISPDWTASGLSSLQVPPAYGSLGTWMFTSVGVGQPVTLPISGLSALVQRFRTLGDTNFSGIRDVQPVSVDVNTQWDDLRAFEMGIKSITAASKSNFGDKFSAQYGVNATDPAVISRFDTNVDNVLSSADLVPFLKLMSLKRGDINQDGVVTADDFNMLSASLQQANPAGYFYWQGDLNLDGDVNATDMEMFQKDYATYDLYGGVVPPQPNEIAFRINSSSTTPVGYGTAQATAPSDQPTLSVTKTLPNIRFATSNGFRIQDTDKIDNKVKLEYFIDSAPAAPFSIGIYRSFDGVTPGALVRMVDITAPSALAVTGATPHSLGNLDLNLNLEDNDPRTINSQPLESIYLLAVIDPQRKVQEANESPVDNQTRFAGGWYYQAGARYFFGTENDDVVVWPTATQAPAGTVHHTFAYLYGGNDQLNAVGKEGAYFIFGGAGNDTLQGGAQGDYLHGGDGNDSLTGGHGYDELTGGDGADTLNSGSSTPLGLEQPGNLVEELIRTGPDRTMAAEDTVVGAGISNQSVNPLTVIADAEDVIQAIEGKMTVTGAAVIGATRRPRIDAIMTPTGNLLQQNKVTARADVPLKFTVRASDPQGALPPNSTPPPLLFTASFDSTHPENTLPNGTPIDLSGAFGSPGQLSNLFNWTPSTALAGHKVAIKITVSYPAAPGLNVVPAEEHVIVEVVTNKNYTLDVVNQPQDQSFIQKDADYPQVLVEAQTPDWQQGDTPESADVKLDFRLFDPNAQSTIPSTTRWRVSKPITGGPVGPPTITNVTVIVNGNTPCSSTQEEITDKGGPNESTSYYCPNSSSVSLHLTVRFQTQPNGTNPPVAPPAAAMFRVEAITPDNQSYRRVVHVRNNGQNVNDLPDFRGGYAPIHVLGNAELDNDAILGAGHLDANFLTEVGGAQFNGSSEKVTIKFTELPQYGDLYIAKAGQGFVPVTAGTDYMVSFPVPNPDIYTRLFYRHSLDQGGNTNRYADRIKYRFVQDINTDKVAIPWGAGEYIERRYNRILCSRK